MENVLHPNPPRLKIFSKLRLIFKKEMMTLLSVILNSRDINLLLKTIKEKDMKWSYNGTDSHTMIKYSSKVSVLEEIKLIFLLIILKNFQDIGLVKCLIIAQQLKPKNLSRNILVLMDSILEEPVSSLKVWI